MLTNARTPSWFLCTQAVDAVLGLPMLSCVLLAIRSFLGLRLELAIVQEVWRQAGEAQHLSQLAEVIPNTPQSEPLPICQ